MLTTAPTLKDRSKKPKRVPGGSGRLHRCKDGQWEFSDEEMDPETPAGIKALSEKGDREGILLEFVMNIKGIFSAIKLN